MVAVTTASQKRGPSAEACVAELFANYYYASI